MSSGQNKRSRLDLLGVPASRSPDPRVVASLGFRLPSPLSPRRWTGSLAGGTLRHKSPAKPVFPDKVIFV